MPDAVALLEYGMAQEREEKLWQRWIVGAQYSISFEEFKRSLRPPQFADETKLMDDVKNILNGGHHGNI